MKEEKVVELVVNFLDKINIYELELSWIETISYIADNIPELSEIYDKIDRKKEENKKLLTEISRVIDITYLRWKMDNKRQ